MLQFFKYITISFLFFIFSTSVFSKEYLQDTTDIDRLKIWEELRDSILPEAPIDQAFDYACLYLSINPENLDVYKGGFVRYGKVNKKKILGYIELVETHSMDLTACNFTKD
tara:strand:+ start:41 stop:373 length:333 start_codon:yes stop_codon:yes gene_type:complete